MILLAFIGLYFLLTIAIGVGATKYIKSAKDFATANKKMPLMISTAAIFATWFGAETMLGAPVEFMKGGMLNIIEDPFGAALCLLLVGMFFARKLYRLDMLTINDLFARRFGRRVEVVASVFMVLSYIGWVAAQLIAVATVLHTVTGISLNIGLWLATLVVLVYTYAGGMFAISITDFVQTVVIIIGLVFITVKLMLMTPDLAAVLHGYPEGFFRFIPPPNAQAWTDYIAAWMVIGLGSIAQQDVFQRVMTSDSEDNAQLSSYLACALYLTVGVLPLVIVILAKANGLVDPAHLNKQTLLLTVIGKDDIWLQVMFFGAFLSAVMSTASGAMLAPATVLAENIIKPALHEKINDKQLLAILRGSVVIIAIAALIISHGSKTIYELVGGASTVSLVSLFVPLVMALWTKTESELGAQFSIWFGVLGLLYADNYGVALMGVNFPGLIVGLCASGFGFLLAWGIETLYLRPSR